MSIKEAYDGPLPVGFLMGLTYRKLAALFQLRLSEYDITPEQWSALNQIDRAQGLIQKEIAERTGKDKPTTTRILDLLEKKGLIYRKTGKNDRRSLLVYSTEQGRALIRDTAEIENSVTAEVKRCMSGEEYNVLLDLLLRTHQQISLAFNKTE
ncbi:MarR family transcriptional regulator [Paenibacillus sp. LHD-117]|uniref:MarR family winged helix-turn-helix transcriptional regulator n=1 Tax=Paenibacillus sp. LHD-117 TaxID=3071412 RepID=UPI0027DF3EB7|nr:MarR family transcriptional regulator [Paenibacillus sp. LHD-117]MDQ6423442.1 MarR family transcriptional regulator [Paenibacillus sp. LHD-117]